MSIRIDGAGGQTGMEGGCTGPRVESLSFSAEDVSRLIAVPYESTLAYRSDAQPDDGTAQHGKPMRVSIVPRGSAREVVECGTGIFLPVELTLSFDDPALDIVFVATLQALAADVAIITSELPSELAAQIGLSGATEAVGPAALTLWLGTDGVRGTIESRGACGMLVFPQDRRCSDGGSVPITLDRETELALSLVDAELPDLTVHAPLGDTRTTMTISQVGVPSEVCSDTLPPTIAPEKKRIALEAHLVSADGWLDLTLPGELNLEAPSAAQRGLWMLHFSAVLPARSVGGPGFMREQDADAEAASSDDAPLWFELLVFRSPTESAQLWLRTLSPHPGTPPLSEPRATRRPACFGDVSQQAQASP